MAVLAIILLKVDLKQEVFLNDSILFSNLMISFYFLFINAAEIPSQIAVETC